jgi:hypothetical protein
MRLPFLGDFHLKRSKEALRAFAYDGGNDCDNRPVLDAIHDYSFWADVDELLDILEPMNQNAPRKD